MPTEIDPSPSNKVKAFFLSLLSGLLRDLLRLAGAFVIGTLAAALVCLYYGFPLVNAVAGGLIVLGVALALTIL